MSLVVIGVSHKQSPVAVREKLAFPGTRHADALGALRAHGVAEAVILSTCNRMEIYANVSAGSRGEELVEFLTEFHGLEEDYFEPYLYRLHGPAVVHHLFRVTSGLDSLVLGETQIVAQIKEAYTRAAEQRAAGRVMHELFQSALRTAKRVHTETGLGEALVSISSVAVDLARKIFGRLDGKGVLLVGAGETAELTLKHLLDGGVRRVLVANRTPENARRLARAVDGVAFGLEDIGENLPLADIVVASSGAPRALISRPDVERALKLRSQAPMFFIDIAVPRDVDPAVHELDNAYVYNIDDLEQTASENLGRRHEQAGEAERIVGDQVDGFVREWRSRCVEPVIRSLHEAFHGIAVAEAEKTLRRLGAPADRTCEEVRYLAQRIVKRLLHEPVKQLKQEARDGDPFSSSQMVARMFRLLGEVGLEPDLGEHLDKPGQTQPQEMA